ncbi:hypothetical protein [Clostridium sp.]|uniref:hypothetical protein n=1 Tax=Clostridium sp. TaxID=1506 RepID=UPI00262F1BFD|nr:hypothetical protein [Clostridium sp.]
MKIFMVIGIVIVAIGLLIESLLNVKSAFKWFSKHSEGEALKDFNYDFKRQFNNLEEGKKEEFISKLEPDEKILFNNYLICSKEEEEDIRRELDNKHIFNLFNRWARQNNIKPINMSSYKNI